VLEVRYGKRSAHDCHISLVPVPERLRGLFAVDSAPYEAGDIRPSLDRDLCDARKQLWPPPPDAEKASGGGGNRRGVADGEHIRVTWNRQVWIHFDTPCPVHINAEPPARRRGDDTRRPQHRAARDALAIDDHAVFVNSLDLRIRVDFDPEPLEVAAGLLRKSLGVVGKIRGAASSAEVSGGLYAAFPLAASCSADSNAVRILPRIRSAISSEERRPVASGFPGTVPRPRFT
jgi:hypothetical protein